MFHFLKISELPKDEEFAAERKAKLKALLDVRKQEGYPPNVDWAGSTLYYTEDVSERGR